MAAESSKSTECCTNSTNLPEEMEEALRQQGGMEGLKGRVPSKESLIMDGKLFNALSDPIRLQILHALDIIDLCPCLLKEIAELSDSKLSYHLSILEEAGLITASPRKRWRIYMLTERARFLMENEAHRSPR